MRCVYFGGLNPTTDEASFQLYYSDAVINESLSIFIYNSGDTAQGVEISLVAKKTEKIIYNADIDAKEWVIIKDLVIEPNNEIKSTVLAVSTITVKLDIS